MNKDLIRKRRISNAVKVTKAIAGIAVPLGVGVVTGRVFDIFRPHEEVKTIIRVLYKVGELSMASMVAAKTVDHTDDLIESVGDGINEIMDLKNGKDI